MRIIDIEPIRLEFMVSGKADPREPFGPTYEIFKKMALQELHRKLALIGLTERYKLMYSEEPLTCVDGCYNIRLIITGRHKDVPDTIELPKA